MTSEEPQDEDSSGGGLMYGVTLYLLRLLTENPLEGGAGVDIRHISEWTPDQVYFRLAKIEVLKAKSKQGGKSGRSGLPSKPLAVRPDENGKVRGRDKDGNPIKGRVGGKSLARRLMEEEAEKKRRGS